MSPRNCLWLSAHAPIPDHVTTFEPARSRQLVSRISNYRNPDAPARPVDTPRDPGYNSDSVCTRSQPVLFGCKRRATAGAVVSTGVGMNIFDFLFGRGGDRDGSSPERAIMVNNVAEEYSWMRSRYPGLQPGTQALTKVDGIPYDVLTWRNDKGDERVVFFDISKFFAG